MGSSGAGLTNVLDPQEDCALASKVRCEEIMVLVLWDACKEPGKGRQPSSGLLPWRPGSPQSWLHLFIPDPLTPHRGSVATLLVWPLAG